jgi:hypothetical protein
VSSLLLLLLLCLMLLPLVLLRRQQYYCKVQLVQLCWQLLRSQICLLAAYWHCCLTG